MLKIDLQKFAFGPSTFATGSTGTVAQSYVIEADFDKTETPVWSEICLTDYKENPNVQTETFTEICKNGFTTTMIKGYDPEFSFDALIRKDTPLAIALMNRYDTFAISDIPFRITNTLMGEQLLTDLTFTSFDLGGSAGDFLKVSLKGKPFGGKPTIVPLTEDNMPDNIVGEPVLP